MCAASSPNRSAKKKASPNKLSGSSGEEEDRFSNAVVTLLNGQLRKLGQKPLGKMKGCDLGTLDRMQLCELVVKRKRVPGLCRVDVRVSELRGLQQLKVLWVRHRTTPDRITLSVKVHLGALRGKFDVSPSEECGALARKGVETFLRCKDSTFSLGSVEKPVTFEAEMVLLGKDFERFDAATQLQVTKFDLSIPTFELGCVGVLRLLPNVAVEKLGQFLSDRTSAKLRKKILLKLVQLLSP